MQAKGDHGGEQANMTKRFCIMSFEQLDQHEPLSCELPKFDSGTTIGYGTWMSRKEVTQTNMGTR
jgi:hypothetical protein